MFSHKRYVLTPSSEQSLPLYAERIGYKPHQEKIIRQDGYPHFHWLQTVTGKGRFSCGEQNFSLPPNSGFLCLPNVAHTYEAISENWTTLYLTFNGLLMVEMLHSLGLHHSSYYHWEEGSPLAKLLNHMLERLQMESDFFGLNTSADLYLFLISLQKYGQTQKNTEVSSNLKTLHPLIKWMEEHLSNPDVGLSEMAAVLSISPRQLNTLFQDTFGQAPYAYFLILRIRKSKELLTAYPHLPIKQVAAEVGFRDTSHFVATFRQYVNLTPKTFRHLD